MNKIHTIFIRSESNLLIYVSLSVIDFPGRRTDTNMEPNLEDILFLKESSYEDRKASEVFGDGNITDEILELIVVNELKGKNYPAYLKYFERNYDSSLKEATKDSQKSIEARNQGNNLFTQTKHNAKIHEDVWKFYSQSIAFAPLGSEELALGYGNRSCLLLHFKKYHDCIKDIDRAVAITKSNPLILKLLCRKMTCLAAIGSTRNEKQILWKTIHSCHKKIDCDEKDEKFVKLINQARSDLLNGCPVDKTNENWSLNVTTNPNVRVVYNPKYGRHYVATRDIAPGEIVCCTKPYVTSANNNKFYAYCNHCLSLMWAGIPCDECSLSMYCSEECKSEAWDSYHKEECKIMPHMNFNHCIYYRLQLSLRVLIMALKEFGDIAKLREEVNGIDSAREFGGKLQSDKTFDSGFLNFYSLPYMNSNDLGTLTKSIKNACFLLAYISQTCNIFDKDIKSLTGKQLAKDKDIVFVVLLLFKLLISTPVHQEHIHEYHSENALCDKHEKGTECTLNRCCSRGIHIEPFGRVFNYNCHPNVSPCCTEDSGKMLYYCDKPIKKNEQLFINKVGSYFGRERAIRRYLMKMSSLQYFCKCQACEEDWPVMAQMLKEYQEGGMNFRKKLLAQSYISRYGPAMEEDGHRRWSKKEMKRLSKDATEIFKNFGEPSYPSALIQSFMSVAFNQMYGLNSFNILSEC